MSVSFIGTAGAFAVKLKAQCFTNSLHVVKQQCISSLNKSRAKVEWCSSAIKGMGMARDCSFYSDGESSSKYHDTHRSRSAPLRKAVPKSISLRVTAS